MRWLVATFDERVLQRDIAGDAIAIARGADEAACTLLLREELILDEALAWQVDEAHVITEMQAGEGDRLAVTDEADAQGGTDARGGPCFGRTSPP